MTHGLDAEAKELLVVATLKRLQGRPARGDGDVGREKLIEAARTILRLRQSPGLSRKAIADAAGVTPALVTYYFPDKGSLLAAATGPVVGERAARLSAILEGTENRQAKLRQIAALFVRINDTEAHLVDYLEACRERDEIDPSLRALLTQGYALLATFYREGVEAGEWRQVGTDEFILALWGMCKHVAQLRGAGDAAAEVRADVVLDLMLNGLATRA